MVFPAAHLSLFYAMIAQAAIVIILLFSLGIGRYLAASKGRAKRGPDGKLVFPEKLVQLSDCVNNQFQVPSLFFVAALLALQVGAAGPIFAILAWVFVAFRALHAVIFVTTNTILHRFLAFVVGALTVLVMWAMILIHLLTIPAI